MPELKGASSVKPDAPSPSAPPPGRGVLLAGAVIVLAGLAAYSNTFSVPLYFDDLPSILDNQTLRNPWLALWHQPNDYGLTVSGRPVLNFSLSLSYLLSGTNVWGYHALNLAIHLFAGLALFGIVRRTLILPSFRSLLAGGGRGRCATSPAAGVGSGSGSVSSASRFPQENATLLGLAVALLWTLHPLQTEAVTYIIQRAESLMGLFFLLTLYCFIRAVGSDAGSPPAGRVSGESVPEGNSRAPWRWFGLSLFSCLLGIGTKEVMVLAPVLVLLYDRTVVAGTFRAAWSQRKWFHLSLAATWLPLLGLLSAAGWNRGHTAGFDVGVAPWAYWLTQFEAVTRYLSLAFWPHPLVFEYGTIWVRLWAVIPQILLVTTLASATLIALWRRPVIGFLGAWFFAILAPTSLVPGTIQMIVEHRMYLPLAAVLALFAGSVATWLGRTGFIALLALAAAAGVITHQRNAVYRTPLGLWQDTVAKRPNGANAQSNLGSALYVQGRIPEALQHYERALQLNPGLVTAHFDYALALIQAGRLTEAEGHCRDAFRLNPRYYPAHYQLGLILLRLNRPGEALDEFARTIETAPAFAEAHHQWALALFRLGRLPEAIAHDEEALQLDPDDAATECDLGVALFQTGRVAEATARFEHALKLNPQLPEAHFNLGLALAKAGQPGPAESHYAEAVRLDPNHAEAQLNLGIALAQSGNLPEALVHLQQAVQLQPALAEAQGNLGLALAQLGRTEEAVRRYREALRIKPMYSEVHYNLGNALLQLHRIREAQGEFAEAVRIDPAFAAAREMLDRVQAFESNGGSTPPP